MPPEKRAAIEREETMSRKRMEELAKKGVAVDKSFTPSTTVVFVAVAPVVLFAGILAARIWYLLVCVCVCAHGGTQGLTAQTLPAHPSRRA